MLIPINLTQTVCSLQKIKIPKAMSAGSEANSHLVRHGCAGLRVSPEMWPQDPSLGPETGRAGGKRKAEEMQA